MKYISMFLISYVVATSSFASGIEGEFTTNISTGFGDYKLSKCVGDCNLINTNNSNALIGFSVQYLGKTKYIDFGLRAGLLDSLAADPKDNGIERIMDVGLIIGKTIGNKYRFYVGPAAALNESVQRYEYAPSVPIQVRGKESFIYGYIGFTALELWRRISLGFEYRYGSYKLGMSGEDRSGKGTDVGVIPVSFNATNTISIFTVNLAGHF